MGNRQSKMTSAHFWSRVCVALHLSCPLQETPQILALAPAELPKFQKSDLRHLDARVGLNPPEKIGTPPRRQVMASGGVPKETKDVMHGFLARSIASGR